MITFRELLEELEKLTPEQRQQDIMLISDRLNLKHTKFYEWFLDGYSENIELRIAQSNVNVACVTHTNGSADASIAEGFKGIPIYMLQPIEGERLVQHTHVTNGMPYLRLYRDNSNYTDFED